MTRREQTPYRHAKWKAIRLQVLERAGYRCQVQGEGCTGKATDADHITPWRDGGAWFALSNLRASCKHCNISRASNQKHQNGWRRSATEIVAVVYDDRAQLESLAVAPGDAVIDLDALTGAFAGGQTSHPSRGVAQLASWAWTKSVAEVRRGEVDTARVWFFTADPSVVDGLPYHEVMRLDGGGELDSAEPSEGLEPDMWL